MRHVTIPPQWHAREALSVVAFLERVIEAVWRAHGPEMAYELHARHTSRDTDRRAPRQLLDQPRHIRPANAVRGIPDDDILY